MWSTTRLTLDRPLVKRIGIFFEQCSHFASFRFSFDQQIQMLTDISLPINVLILFELNYPDFLYEGFKLLISEHTKAPNVSKIRSFLRNSSIILLEQALLESFKLYSQKPAFRFDINAFRIFLAFQGFEHQSPLSFQRLHICEVLPMRDSCNSEI